MADTEGSKSGWSDRELLSSLLSILDHDNISLNYKNGIYPAGRNASGFSQKLARFKNSLKPEWEAMVAGQPVNSSTPAKPKASPRKRKPKTEENSNGDTEGSPKKRGRAKKAAESKKKEEADAVKDEVQDDDVDAVGEDQD